MNAIEATQPSSGPHSEQSATIVPVSLPLSSELATAVVSASDEVSLPSMPVGPTPLEPPVSLPLPVPPVLALPVELSSAADDCEALVEGPLASSEPEPLVEPETTSPGSEEQAAVASESKRSLAWGSFMRVFP